MSNRAMSWAVEVREVGGHAKLVLMLLADCHNASTGQCNPSEEWLVARTGFGVRTLVRHITTLVKAGLVERLVEHSGRGQGSRHAGYRLRIGVGTQLAPNVAKPAQKMAPATKLQKTKAARAKKPVPDLAPANQLQKTDLVNARANFCKRTYRGTGKEPYIVASMDATEAFTHIWDVWSSIGRQRSKAKAKCEEALKRAVSSSGFSFEQIVAAAKKYAANTEGQYHKGLDRWLADGRYEPFILKHQPAKLSDGEWLARCRSWLRGKPWPADWRAPPNSQATEVPVAVLRAFLDEIPEHDMKRVAIEHIVLGRETAQLALAGRSREAAN